MEEEMHEQEERQPTQPTAVAAESPEPSVDEQKLIKEAQERKEKEELNALVERAKLGDQEAWDDLDARYRLMITRYITNQFHLNQEEVEEIVQDSFLKAFRFLSEYSGAKGSFTGWIKTMAYRTTLDYLRHVKSRPQAAYLDDEETLNTMESMADSTNVEAEALSGLTVAEIKNALNQIPESQRVAIALFYFGNLTQPEIAERYNIPLSTVKTRMRLGLIALRAHLKSEPVE